MRWAGIVRQFIVLPKNKLNAITNKVHRNEGEKREKRPTDLNIMQTQNVRNEKSEVFYLYVGKVYHMQNITFILYNKIKKNNLNTLKLPG